MASFRESWQRCFWCGAWGKCNPGFEPTVLIKSRTATALLCVTCVKAGEPPHADYLHCILGQVLPGLRQQNLVAQFVWPICANPYLGVCFICDSSWTGWSCRVCDFARTYDASAMHMLPAIEDVYGYEPKKLRIGRGDFGSAEIDLWRRQMIFWDK